MVQNNQDLRDALVDSPGYLADLLARCAFSENRFYDRRTQEKSMVESDLTSVYKAVLRYTSAILAIERPDRGRKFWNSVTGNTVQHLIELRDGVKSAEEQLQGSLQLEALSRSEQNVTTILNKIDQKVLASLDYLMKEAALPIAKGASWDSAADQHKAICLDDTRVGVRHQISKWIDSPDSKPTFCINGMAGTGKSTIARTIAKSCSERGQLGASFFFSRTDNDRANATLFISTIAKQLMSYNQQLAIAILSAIKHDSDITTKNLNTQASSLIFKPLEKVVFEQGKAFVIVLDAVDECNEDDLELILEFLTKLEKGSFVGLRIFVTSRPTHLIQRAFANRCVDEYLALEDLPMCDTKNDIHLFVSDELDKIRLNYPGYSDKWPGNDNIEKLVEFALPLFQFATTMCRFIGDGIEPPKKRLAKIMESNGKSQGRQMDVLYLSVLENVVNSDDDNNLRTFKQNFSDIVGALVLLAVPLPAHSLARILHRDEEDVDFLLEKLHSVLDIPKNPHSPVAILHLSFQEFLLSTQTDFQVHGSAKHAEIASHCIRMMDENLKRNICRLESFNTENMDIDQQTIEQHLCPELQYSCRYWTHHLKGSGDHMCEIEIFPFLKRHFLHLLEALSLMGVLSEAVSMINDLNQSNVSSGVI